MGPARGKALKSIRKINQMFEDRRLFSAHMIFHPATPEWHLFYFDQRDWQQRGNHFHKGSHIHYSRHDIVRASAARIWEGVMASPPKPPKSEHVRYNHAD